MSHYNTSLYDLGDVIPQSYHPVGYSPNRRDWLAQKQEMLQPVVQRDAIVFSMVTNMVIEQPVEENHDTVHQLDLTG